jgi:PAS domain S-box-containing protein
MLFLLLVFLLLSQPILTLNAVAQEPTKRVLILSGYDPNRPAVPILTQAIRSTISRGSPGRVEFYTEFQDNARIVNANYEKEMVGYLRQKYAGENISLVIGLGAPSREFLLNHEPELFTNTPKVFYFHDEREETVRKLWPRVTGVWAQMNLRGTLELALRLHPDTRRVVVVSGNSVQEKFLKEEAQREFRPYESKTEFTYLSDLTIEELKSRLAGLPEKTVVVYLAFLLDKAGNNYSGPEGLALVAPASSAPIYGISQTYLGSGIVGGSLLNFEALGRRTGELSLRVLAGERLADIAPETVPTIQMFDSRELERWGLSEQKLPAGSIVRFKVPTFWELNKWYVLGAVAVFIIEAALIAYLLFQRRRRRYAERESKRLARIADAEHRHLNEVVSNVPGVVWESRTDPSTGARKTTFVSDYVEKMLGYNAEQWESTPGFALQLVHEEDRERVRREAEALIAGKQGGAIRFRWLAKDGRILWVVAHIAPILEEDGTIVGVRGVTLDMTEQKLAEEAQTKSEERSRAILQAVPDLMFLQSRDGVFLDYHAKRREDLLVPPEVFLGKNMRSILPAELAGDFFQCFERAETGETQVVEYELPVNGAERWFEARIVRSGENILSVVRDVTSRKKVENSLRENEAQLAGIIGSAMDAIITINERQEIVLFNTTAEKMFHCSAEEAIGGPLARFIPERFRAEHREHIRLFGQKNITRRPMEMPGGLFALRTSGEEFPIEASISQVELHGAKFYTVILRDITERMRAETEIRESETNYRSIFNAAHDAIFIQALDTGKILDANQRIIELYGWTVDEARQLTIADLSANEPPYSQKEALDLIRKVASGEPQLFEWRAKHKSGRLFWVEVNLKRVLLRGHHVLLAVVRDITDRKHAIDLLRQSEERFGKAFRANPQPMSLTTVSGGLYLDVNESFLTMSGYTREDVIGHTSLELNIWETPAARSAFIQKLNDEGSITNLETKFRTKNGSMRVLLSSAERLEIAGEECLLVASSDITERVEAERALQESELRFRNMADTAPVMIWVSGEDKRCTYVNKRWVDFTGRSPELELGDGWTEGINPDDQARCWEVFATNFDQRTPFEMEYRLRRKDGVYRWVFDTGTPRFSADGKFLGFIGSCIDITERKESEVALQKAHAELGELKNKLEAENIYLQQELQLDQTFGEIIGQSDAIKYVLFKVTQVAPTDSTVLITGETGTGKELVARAIHAVSSRKDQPLIRVNCAALSPNLIESEFFGHERGAFTGAVTRKLGRFELANGGTIFLDEIGELPTELQVKLLRVIQEGEIERIGGTKTIPVDVRIIAATNRNLKLEVEKGSFREDLWYRLNVFPITVPPLRQRKEDIPLLVEHFVSKSAKRFGKTITSVSPSAIHSLRLHSWPGNVRELANVIERAVIYTQGDVLKVVDRFEPPEEPLASLPKSLEEVEREYIIRTLESTGWRIEGQYGAAKILGINPSTLRTRMVKLAIQRVRSTYV